MRQCKTCTKEKALADFHSYWSKAGKQYWRTSCKDCENAKARQHYDPEKRKQRYLSRVGDVPGNNLPKDPMGDPDHRLRLPIVVRNRREADLDLLHMERWAEAGFTSGGVES